MCVSTSVRRPAVRLRWDTVAHSVTHPGGTVSRERAAAGCSAGTATLWAQGRRGSSAQNGKSSLRSVAWALELRDQARQTPFLYRRPSSSCSHQEVSAVIFFSTCAGGRCLSGDFEPKGLAAPVQNACCKQGWHLHLPFVPTAAPSPLPLLLSNKDTLASTAFFRKAQSCRLPWLWLHAGLEKKRRPLPLASLIPQLIGSQWKGSGSVIQLSSEHSEMETDAGEEESCSWDLSLFPCILLGGGRLSTGISFLSLGPTSSWPRANRRC